MLLVLCKGVFWNFTGNCSYTVSRYTVPKHNDIMSERGEKMRGETMPTIDKTKIEGEYLNGAYSELASIIGIDAVLKIHSNYRGTSMFFPVELFSREFILSQIVDEYNGHNIKQLATKYGYTEKWIRKILKEHIDKGD